jgi:predicted O-methyltransferase YrrM
MPAKLMTDKRYFRVWEKKGFHVTTNHFYEPVPDTSALRDNLWDKHSEAPGVVMNELRQLSLLSEFQANLKSEYDCIPINRTSVQYQYYIRNMSFTEVDGEILYCMIRRFKPQTIFEIGGGFSTYLSAQALLKNKENENIKSELVSFEPYPNEVLRKGIPNLSRLVTKEIQEVDLSEFRKLKENDILFIDSSHVLKIGSDVQYEYLEILPRLSKGVIVHIHDIFIPSEYPREWVLKGYRFWNEQYLLQSFLAFNDSFEVLWAGSYMHLKHPEKLAAAFQSYTKSVSYPASFWIRKTK